MLPFKNETEYEYKFLSAISIQFAKRKYKSKYVNTPFTNVTNDSVEPKFAFNYVASRWRVRTSYG